MKIGFIGNGWRTRGYWRIVRQVPEAFQISGVLFRDPAKAQAFTQAPAFTDLTDFLQQDHDMIMILIPRKVVFPYIEACVAAGFPVLVETPPAPDVEGLVKVWELQQKYNAKIQVAEQYFLQPYHSAVRALCEQGLLGDVHNLRIAMAHDYHGISVMRKLLDAGDRLCTITAQRFDVPVLYHCGRGGMEEPRMVTDHRKVANFVFENGKVGFFDFADEQYFNYFRSRHMQVQGTQGEINDYQVSWWNGTMPMTGRLERQDLGQDSNLEGYFHRGISFNGEIVYTSPFAQFTEARLTDDEIGMGSLLLGMDRLIRTGEEIYPLKEALQDTYLYLMMDEAIRTGQSVQTEPMPWNSGE